MNGHVTTDRKIADDFVPSAWLNSSGSNIVVTLIADDCRVVTYSAEEARRYAEAFTRAAGLHEQATGGEQS